MNSLHAVQVYMSVRIRLVNLYLRAPMFYIPILSMEPIWFIFVMIQYSFFWMFFLQKCFDIIFDANCSHLFYLPMSACSVMALPSKNYKKNSIRAQWWKISQWLYLFPAITNITQYKYFVFVPVFVLFGSGSIVKSETDSDPTFIFTWSEIK